MGKAKRIKEKRRKKPVLIDVQHDFVLPNEFYLLSDEPAAIGLSREKPEFRRNTEEEQRRIMAFLDKYRNVITAHVYNPMFSVDIFGPELWRDTPEEGDVP